MAGIMTHIASVSILLIVMVTVCNGIICFDCHSTQNSKCGDNFRIETSDLDSRFECFGSCFKRRGKRSSGGGEVRRTEVQRGCMAYRKEGCFSEKFNNLDQNTCVCNSNFCNVSSVSHVPIYLLVFSVFVTLFSLKYCMRN